jgi:hypothetical protein
MTPYNDQAVSCRPAEWTSPLSRSQRIALK